MAKEAWYINESELDDYQTPIIQKKMSSSFVVKGCAGSGKTVLALWKAREIDDAELGSYYVVVYTKALRQFINDGVDEVGLEQSRVMHHYRWKNNGHKSADYIIVDEVQDFTKDELTELQNSAKKAFILFGDSAQQIYKGLKNNLMTMEQIAYHTALPMEQLVLNHRLPKKIARIAEYANSTGDSLESRCTKEGANKPFLVKASNWSQQLDFIMDTIDERGYTDVGILLPDNKLVKAADEYYKGKEFQVEAKYDISWPDDTKFTLNFHSENPKILTYHSAKGLQFEAVFIPECSDYNIKKRDENPLYVALTRTYQDLFVLYSDSLTDLLSGIPKSLFEAVDLDEEALDLPF
ncbi:MAG: AAA family ATPase [Altibacter sp.]|uniref:3'-5' exonuclease n=1 Tax=Altibacter sp. TaxID=2024823 RepID=UPI001DB21C92|nr:3'-5' exonuclease [Altibacter sp.]MBZ0328274.1 AAA family ATPase [Altibacter sp.]